MRIEEAGDEAETEQASKVEAARGISRRGHHRKYAATRWRTPRGSAFCGNELIVDSWTLPSKYFDVRGYVSQYQVSIKDAEHP